jgi:RecB family endonuclease NucS
MIKPILNLSNEPNKLILQLNKILRKYMIIITGSCSAIFDGRIKSTLSEGDRLLIIKKDESIILNNPIGVKPVQWQKPGVGKVNFTVNKDNQVRMETYRPKTDESFFITFSIIYFAFAYYSKTDLEISETIGDEKDLVNYLIQHPEIIEEGLEIIEKEKEIDFGFIDIFARDKNSNLVVIEVKKQSATPNDAYQLKRYIEFFGNQGIYVRGILVANNFPSKVVKYLKNYELDSCEVPWQKIFPTIKRPSSIIRTQNLDNFF